MCMPWMSARGLALAIPLQYGRYVGSLLAAQLCRSAGIPESMVIEEMLVIRTRMSRPNQPSYSPEFTDWLWRCAK